MNPLETRTFLRRHVAREARDHFGVVDPAFIDSVTDNWFRDEENYDGRWPVILERRGAAVTGDAGRVLDLAAGCGTFLIYGLRRGYDVIGVEPEPWKREYFRRRTRDLALPAASASRLVAGIGERLPFRDACFDVVTTYQTIEHVQDVRACLREMLRVLAPGGALYIKAPDYDCFFEPHYRLPFLPCMSKTLASLYLGWLGRPLSGLRSLRWVTERKVVRILRDAGLPLRIRRGRDAAAEARRERIRARLPGALRRAWILSSIEAALGAREALQSIRHLGSAEAVIDLWVDRPR